MKKKILIGNTLLVFDDGQNVEFVWLGGEDYSCDFGRTYKALQETGYFPEFEKQHPAIAECLKGIENGTTERGTFRTRPRW